METAVELDIKRIQGLTDATFAVAMTVLILEIEIPGGLNSTHLFEIIFKEIVPSLFIYFLSFIIIGAFWIDSHFHHHLLVKTDRISSWLNIVFLMFICVIPFSSSFLIKYPHDKLSAVFYCINLVSVSICHLCMLIYTWRKEFIKPSISYRLYRNMKLRVLIPILTYSLLIYLSFYISDWIKFLFLVPLLFQIVFGRSRKEFITKK